jgi:4-amino-4-deoxy-L-arabinose transferase-like glycosyltransferase
VIAVDRPAALSRPWTRLAAAWVIAVIALVAWIASTPRPSLRAQLAVLQLWSLEFTVFFGVAVAAVVLYEVARTLTRHDFVNVVVLATMAIVLVVSIPPRTNRIFYDEQIYQNIGQNLADMKRAQMCNDGTIDGGRLRCAIGEYNKQPYAYPHLLSLAYRVVGVRASVPFAINATAAGLAAAFLYLFVVVLFDDRVAAFFAAALLLSMPEQLVWSATAAVEPSAELATIAALLATACCVRLRSAASLAGAAVATAYAVQFRPESLLILPAVVLLIWQRARDELSQPRIWWAGLLFLGLAAVHVAHLAAVANEGWGTTQARMSAAYVADNLRVNGAFFVADQRFPALYTLLAVVGLCAWRDRAGRATLAVFFCLFFGVTLSFYAGSYDYGADVRFSLAAYPAVAALGGLGAGRLAASIRGMPRRVGAAALMAAMGGMFFWWYAPVARSTRDTASAARADVEFATAFAPLVRGRAYVLTHNPGMLQVLGVSAGQMSFAAADPSRLDDLSRRFDDGVYLHWNFWCNVHDPVQSGYCDRILALHAGEVVREYRVGDQRFALYRLLPGHKE